MGNILIIGIGNPVPSFIHRRLAALIEAGIQLTVLAEHGQRVELEGAQIIYLADSRSRWSQVVAFVSAWVSPGKFFRLMTTRPELTLLQRIRWACKYLPLTRISPPGVIHVQWLSAVTEFQWLRLFFPSPIIASARGSQVTVYPVTRNGFLEKVKKAIQLADYIHCVSKDIANVCETLGASKEKIRINYNGIDLQKFSPAPAKRTDSFVLISVGTMMWRKGFGYQLQVLKRLRESGDAKLLWIGDGPDREALQYQAVKLGVVDQVTFVGKIAASELPVWLNQADVYVSASAAEGLANSVVEASACGLPVVTFACEGMAEVLEDQVTGFILPFGDVEGMTEKIQILKDSPERSRQMAKAARARMIEKFDEKKWVSHMIETYKTIEKR